MTCKNTCGDARDNCPVTPPGVRREHWPLIDPARAEGDEKAIMAVFRAVRDEIRERVGKLLDKDSDGLAGHF